MKKWKSCSIICGCLFFLGQCSPKPAEPVKIGINPWPGYEFLYLADQLGYFEDMGLPVRIVQYSSLADVQRAFMMGQVDGMTTTGIELVLSSYHSKKRPKVVFVADYSHGGDVIVGVGENIQTMADLRGQKVGLELNSLGLFMLYRALQLNQMTLDDVVATNVEVIQLAHALNEGEVVAGIAYPPVSVDLLQMDHAKVLFDSKQIPEEVVDVISVSEASLQKHPGFIKTFRAVWDRTLDYCEKNPDKAYAIMAARERISTQEFKQSLQGIIVLRGNQQEALMQKGGKLEKTLQSVETSLRSVGLLKEQSQTMDYIYRER